MGDIVERRGRGKFGDQISSGWVFHRWDDSGIDLAIGGFGAGLKEGLECPLQGESLEVDQGAPFKV